MTRTYDIDITAPAFDSLEGVMGQIYTDVFNPLLETDALRAFRALLQLFTARLALTTNQIEATNKRLLYRLITYYLSENIRPSDITIVTFNQDLQVEKILELIQATSRWSRVAEDVFNFPSCYGFKADSITSPTGGGASLFEITDARNSCIKVLKLHGSLNWYSVHNSPRIRPTAMFNRTRRISITRRKTIDPTMTYTGGGRTQYTLPMIVPPVTHKSGVLHQKLMDVWRASEDALSEAEEIIIFGYSCPPLDFESSNQLRRAQRRSSSRSCKISILDPDPRIPSRYAELLQPKRLYYYPSARDFLSDR